MEITHLILYFDKSASRFIPHVSIDRIWQESTVRNNWKEWRKFLTKSLCILAKGVARNNEGDDAKAAIVETTAKSRLPFRHCCCCWGCWLAGFKINFKASYECWSCKESWGKKVFYLKWYFSRCHLTILYYTIIYYTNARVVREKELFRLSRANRKVVSSMRGTDERTNLSISKLTSVSTRPVKV